MKTVLKLTYFFLLIAFFLPAYLSAQTVAKTTVRGKIIDQKDKQPIAGASVIELDKDKRTVSGTVTDIEGNFALRVTNTQNQIKVTVIGYRPVTENINGRAVINVALSPASNTLTDVAIIGQRSVNNGTGLNIDARNSTMATTTIDAKALEELSATSIDQALQGRMPGVDIGATSGDPGAGMSIRIRGTSSINGSADPLIVLDGMPYETKVPDDFNFGSADEQGYAQLLNIAPSDIKEITVLKDAASTAVWGSRAANGVLIINTKRGLVGKPVINYNFKGTLSRQPAPIPLLSGDQYAMLIPEEIANRNGLPINSLNFPEFNYDKRDPFNYYNYSNNTDWIGALTQTGYIQDHNVSMQGGGEKARYFASVGYLDQRGTTVGTALGRITSKINLDYNVSNRIRFRSDFSYTHVNNDLNFTSAIRDVAYSKMPNMSMYQYDEFGNLTPVFFSPASNIQGQASYNTNSKTVSGTYNPLAMAKAATSTQIGERIVPHFNLQYNMLPGVLLATFDLQFDINNTKSKNFLPQIATGRPSTETLVNRATDNDGDTYAVDSKLNFVFTPKLKSERHTFQSLLSFQTSDSKSLAQMITTANTASSSLQDASDPARVQNGDFILATSNVQSRILGVVLANQYSFLDRYIINVGGRLDGNSKLSKENRFGVFPSLSARWRMSGEPFMKRFSFINDLSWRLSYGYSGSTPGNNYIFYNTYNPTASSYAGLSGVMVGNLGLDNLEWQTKIGRNAGFNFSAFKSRLQLDVEVYNDKTINLLSAVSSDATTGLKTPAYTGYTAITANVGTMLNRGFEISLNTVPYKSRKLTVNFDFNIAKNQNVMKEISDQFSKTDGRKVNVNGVYRTYLQVGNPFGSFYGFRYKGVYKDAEATIARGLSGNPIVTPSGQSVYMRFNYPQTDYVFQPGDAMYEDINKDGNINEDDIVYLGNGTPKVSGGFGPSVTLNGNLKIQAFFSYRLGYELINESIMNTSNMYGYNNQNTMVLRRWRNPGDVTDVPRALQGMGYNWLGSDRYVSDASFVRLRSVTVRYNLAKPLLNKLKMKNSSVYMTAENLFTWTRYQGVEPDISARGSSNPFSYVSDKSLTPSSKNLTLGLTVGF